MVVIGLVGLFGSGCSYVGKWIEKNRNYKLVSLSAELKRLFQEKKSKEKNN